MESTLHRKKTSGNSTIHASSFHPSNLIRSIPYGEFLRLRRICSTEETFEKCIKDSSLRFQARGYNEKTIYSALRKVRAISREDLFKTKITPINTDSTTYSPDDMSNTGLRFVTTYSRQHRKVRAIINKHWPIIQTDPALVLLFPTPPTLTFRRSKSMHNTLVKSSPELTTKTSQPSSMWLAPRNGFIKCNTCRACKFGINTSQISTVYGPSIYKITARYSCRTEYAVYVLRCACRLVYVGSTKLQVHMRIPQHLRAIVNSDTAYPVARHFKAVHHNLLNYLEYFVVAAIPP